MTRIHFIEQPCKSVLNRVHGMPFRWSINPYSGCSHSCRYCYARAFYTRAEHGSAADFDSQVYVKVNAPDVLRHELSRRTWRRELVVVGAATDPYQPAEGRYWITRGILEALRDFRTPVSLITKGTMILRDLDVLQQLQATAGVDVNVTIPTVDDDLWRSLEPGTPSPQARLEAVSRLNAAGIPAGVFIAPILPGLTDTEASLRPLIAAAAEAGAAFAVPITLRLAPVVKEWFLLHLDREYPHLLPRYRALYRQTEAPADYKQGVRGLAARLLREAGLPLGHSEAGVSLPPPPPQPVQLQLSL